ncbi:MAG: right-handed parallel beta-helix repeat-containing protein, partial [Planctomycetales bacterium]|nr:right-handed parallel beta-helix repeat-containing protein [Planctomycetales bacterium]
QCASEAARLERAIAFTAKSCRIDQCLVGTRVVVRTAADPNAAPAGSAPRWEHCVFDNNGTPIALERAKSQGEIALVGCTFSNSSRYSLELADCDIELSSTWNDSWNLDRAPSLLKAVDGRLTLRDLVIKDYSNYALITQRNILRLTNVVFRNNLIGLYAAESSDLRATNCQWLGHRISPSVNPATTAIFLQGKGVFSNCRIDNNQTGVWLQGSETGDVVFNGTTVTNSLFRALHLFQCRMRLDSTFLSPFDLQGVSHGIYITGGQIEVRDATIRNARGTGMLVTGGCRFTADGCTFEDNAQATETTSRHAGLLGDGNLSFTVRNCVFQRQSTGYGLATSLVTDVTQCVFKNNHIGVALLRCNTPLAFSNCVITANRIGVYGEDSNVAITPLTMDNSLPVDNDFNIYLTKGQYEISDITLRRG